jgi:YVTN family beta-propeller protein
MTTRMTVKRDPVFVRRRRVALVALLSVVGVTGFGVNHLLGGDAGQASAAAATGATSTAQQTQAAQHVTPIKPAPAPSPDAKQGAPAPAAESALVRIQRLTGQLTPKSVVASSTGRVFAQNMMYTHTVSAFDADGALLATIKDGVDLAAYGVKGHPGTSQGAPVEAAFSPNGKVAWVSNYAMYGAGFSPEGKDACTSAAGVSRSFVYKIDTSTFEVTKVVKAGAVPKYVAVTPNGKQVLVTNWCSMDLTVIDARTAKVIATIAIPGAHPRGIAVSRDSTTAYVAVMGSGKVVAVNLKTHRVSLLAKTGDGPRHLVLSKDGTTLYVTNNGSGTVTAVDIATRKVVGTLKVGREPRSMAMSSDGGALYVVSYDDARLVKIRTSDFSIVQSVPTDGYPVGVTYEPTKKRVWVACYGGSILVFDDSRAAA